MDICSLKSRVGVKILHRTTWIFVCYLQGNFITGPTSILGVLKTWLIFKKFWMIETFHPPIPMHVENVPFFVFFSLSKCGLLNTRQYIQYLGLVGILKLQLQNINLVSNATQLEDKFRILKLTSLRSPLAQKGMNFLKIFKIVLTPRIHDSYCSCWYCFVTKKTPS